MSSCVHVYPFLPWGVDGGTLRLRTAAEGSTAFDSVRVLYWSGEEWLWTEPETVTESRRVVGTVFAADSLKRRVFPSTLWESSRRAIAAFPPGVIGDPDLVVIHTTYLAGLISALKRTARTKFVIDVYDLVWRAHQFDVPLATSGAIRTARRIYAATVKPREERAFRRADGVAVAGWTDLQHLPKLKSPVEWIPTGLDIVECGPPPSGPQKVGLIGSFAHSATVDAANALVAAHLNRPGTFEVVVAGAHSEEWAVHHPGVTALGRVESVTEFYSRVHASVVPVGNGSGMKCKLAESVLAGRPVVTTSEGGEGFPPELARFFLVKPSEELNAEDLATALLHLPEARRAFQVVERSSAAASYAELFAHTLSS